MNLSVNSQFEEFYQSVYGDRWPRLRDALLKKEIQAARWNAFRGAPPTDLKPTLLENCFPSEGVQPLRDDSGLLDFYVMDPASVVVARALDVQPADRVLDMCAAPGGKALVLSESIGEDGELIANEISEGRRDRLTKVIQQYVPRDRRDQIWVKGADGVRFGLKEPGSFDRVLLDAPCSGERHLLETPKEYDAWTVKRTKGLAQRQYALICGALLALKPGGRLVYSTCALSQFENDGVVEKFLKKKGDQIQSLPAEEVYRSTAKTLTEIEYEKTEYGLIFLPDRCGFGPMYFSVLERLG